MRMYPVSSRQIKSMQRASQKLHDCYLVASLGALSNSAKGRKIILNNISHSLDAYNVHFPSINGISEDYLVDKNSIVDLFQKTENEEISSIHNVNSPLTRAVELAVNALIKKHPFKKPPIYRLFASKHNCEYNKPSRFLKMFTGKKPITLNEGGVSMSLFSKYSKAKKLLEQIGQDPNAVFVAGTGMNSWGNLPTWHCYVIKRVDTKNNKLLLFDHKEQAEIVLPIQNAIHQLKFITGFFSKDLT